MSEVVKTKGVAHNNLYIIFNQTGRGTCHGSPRSTFRLSSSFVQTSSATSVSRPLQSLIHPPSDTVLCNESHSNRGACEFDVIRFLNDN
eukprot:SAG22_NODE_18797_length_281_cov_0.857143_1_plen_88_part_01